MKFESIKIIGDPVLDDVELNFKTSTNDIADNIVFIGENGAGKTHLLEAIADFGAWNNATLNNTLREYVVRLTTSEMKVIVKSLNGRISLKNPNRFFKIVLSPNQSPGSPQRLRVWYMSDDGPLAREMHEIPNAYIFVNNEEVGRIFRTVYSTIDVTYAPNRIANVTGLDIDTVSSAPIKSSQNLATEIKQLFVDIQSSDANDLFYWVKEHPGEAPSRAVQTRRMGRFIYAFSKIFGNLNYDHTEVRDGRQEVLFKKEGKLVSLDNLSSGEKQIVFRGGFLLSNQQTTIGTPVLIDEPEISLHPLWQKKAFDFYRKLSVASNGQQTSQVFFATHSEYILDTAFSDDEKTIIIVCQDGRCNLIDKKLYSAVFPVTTAAELRYRIFNIISIDFHIQLYAYIQKLSNTSRSILKCDQFIEKSSSYNKAEHEKISSYNNTKYHTISTYIRNAIDHPGEGKEYSEEELDASVKLMISIIRNENSKKA